MTWFALTGDERITKRCATDDCGGQPTWRMEAGGVGSDYCSGCKATVEGRCSHYTYSQDRVTGECTCDACGKVVIDCLGRVSD